MKTYLKIILFICLFPLLIVWTLLSFCLAIVAACADALGHKDVDKAVMNLTIFREWE